MKKQYEKPTMTVVEIHQQSIICTSPGGSTDPGTHEEIGGGIQFARRHSVWDDDWDEE